MSGLVLADTSSGVAISDYLSKARDWLATAVEMTGPEQIAMAKAEIATAAEATKQLGLSKEIQLDAQEMVRRAEYALGKAIRKGQAEGTIGIRGRHLHHSGDDVRRPEDFASRSELYGNDGGTGAIPMSALSEADFDSAIEAAKADGNLSRANVARQARGAPKPFRALSDDASLSLINDLRGPWSRGLVKAASAMTPEARAHVIAALELTLSQIKDI